MATFDDLIDVTVTSDAGLAGPTVFNRMLIATSESFAERVRWYETYADAAADSELSSVALGFLATAFGQDEVAQPIAVGRCAQEIAQIDVATVLTAAAGDWVLAVNGVDAEFTAGGGDSALQIADGLRAALALLISAGLAVSQTADDEATEIKAVIPGAPIMVEITAPSGGAGGVVTQRANLPVSDELAAIRAFDSDWYGLILPAHTPQTSKLHAAAWAETQTVLHILPVASVANGLAVTALGYSNTVVCFHSDNSVSLALALASFKLAADPDSVATTWAWASLAGIAADETISAGDAMSARAGKVNLYLQSFAGPITGPGRCADGTAVANKVAKDWAEARINEATAAILLNASNRNEKIPYDNGGIMTLGGAVSDVLARGERIGHFVAGSSVVAPPSLADVSDADIVAETLRMTARTLLAGAINGVVFRIKIVTA